MTTPSASAPSVSTSTPASAPSSAPSSGSSTPSSTSGSTPQGHPPSGTPSSSGSSNAPSSSGGSNTPSGTGRVGDIAQNAVNKAMGDKPSPTEQAAQPDLSDMTSKQIEDWVLKVNGREVKVTADEAKRRLQMEMAAEERFKQASEQSKLVQQFVDTLKSDPMSILTNPELGINFRELAEDYLSKQIQREMLPPEQRELEDLREFKRSQEEQRQLAEQEQLSAGQQRQLQEQQARITKDYDTKLTAALEKADISKTPEAVKKVVEVLRNAVANGYDMDMETAVDIAKESMSTDLVTYTRNLEGDRLVKFLGEDVVKKLRKHDLARLKAMQQSNQPAPQQISNPPSQPRERASQEPEQFKAAEWKEHLRRKAGL